MPVVDLARADVVTADVDASVTALASTMDERNVGSIVVTRDDEPVGVVTDRDLAIRVLARAADPSDATAADVMSEEPHTIEQDAGFYRAAKLMSEKGIRRLPVCDAGKLVGIITADDLTELLADEQGELAEIIRSQRPPY